MEPHQATTELPETPSAEAVEEEDPRDGLEKRLRAGASWFYWVAGLSLVNSLVAMFDGEWGFIFGLGVTQMVDGIAWAVAQEAADLATVSKVVSFGTNVVIVGVVALMGWLAHKRMAWVFVVGLVLYLFDAGLCLLVGDFLSLAFHAWVVIAVTSGLLACRKLQAMDALEAPSVEEAFSPA